MRTSCKNYKSFNRTRPTRVINLPKRHYRPGQAARPAARSLPAPELLALLMALACLLLVGAVSAGCSVAVASGLALGPAAAALMLAGGLLASEVGAALGPNLGRGSLGREVRYG